MKPKNIDAIQRAAGFIEGISWLADEKIVEALISVLEILDGVLRDEEQSHE